MRLESVFDSLSVLSSLWGGLGGQVCPSSLPALPYEITRTLEPRAYSGVTAFVGVSVVPMDTERVLLNQTVLVEGERITALGPAGKINVPTNAVRIDGRGKYLIPGLADLHAHYAGYEKHDARIARHLGGGVTAFRNNNPIRLNELPIVRSAHTTDGKVSPYIYVAGDRIDEFAKPGMSAGSIAAAYKAAGYDFIIGLGADSLLAAARDLGLPIALHGHEKPLASILRAGRYRGSYDHLYAFFGDLGWDVLKPQENGDTSTSKIRELAAATQRAGLWITPTMVCQEPWGSPTLDIARRVVKALQDAGVGLLLGSDGFSAASELAALVGAGLTPYQALRTSTSNVAQHFGVLDDRGTITVGKRADLALLSGNPLVDIRHAREILGVMAAGRWLDRSALDQLLVASSPNIWLAEALAVLMVELRSTSEQEQNILAFRKLVDSLTGAGLPKQGTSGTAQDLAQRLANELSAIRRTLTPKHHERFDPLARVWLREQARRGQPVAISGVAFIASR